MRRVASPRRNNRPATGAMKIGEGPLPGTPDKVRKRPLIGSSPRSSNGRTPALQVRQSRSESWPRDQEAAESVAAQTTTGPLINHSGVSPSDQPAGTI